MNKTIRTLTAAAAALFAAGSLAAQPAIKLLVVDMAKVFDNHYKTEEVNAKFREAEQKAQEQIEELNKQGQGLVDEYKALMEQSKNTVLTQEARTKAEGDAQGKLQEIQRKQEEVNAFRVNTRNSLQQRIKTHRDLLLEEITKVVNEIARKKGATLVLEKSGPTLFGTSAVLFADSGFEITDEVLAEVNKDRPAAAAGAPAAAPAAAPSAAAGQFTVPNVTPQKKP